MVARKIPEARHLVGRIDGNRKSALLAHRGREQLAPHAHERGRRELAAASDQAPDDFRLARGLVSGGAAIAPFDLGNARNYLDALDQQVLQPVVDLVDAPAQLFEIGRAVWHGSDRCRDAIAVASCRGKIKENVDMPWPD